MPKKRKTNYKQIGAAGLGGAMLGTLPDRILPRWYENGRVKYKVRYKNDANIDVQCWNLSGYECTCFTYPDEIGCL